MKKQNNVKRLVFAALLAGSVIGIGERANAGLWRENPTAMTSAILFSPTWGLTLMTWLDDLSDKKQALALAAIEDAAVFYESGKLTGILPSVLELLRRESAELSQLTETELVDAVIGAAEAGLEDVN